MLVRLLGLFDGQLWLLLEVILHRIDEFVDIGHQFCLVSLHVLESGSGYFQQQLLFQELELHIPGDSIVSGVFLEHDILNLLPQLFIGLFLFLPFQVLLPEEYEVTPLSV